MLSQGGRQGIPRFSFLRVLLFGVLQIYFSLRLVLVGPKQQNEAWRTEQLLQGAVEGWEGRETEAQGACREQNTVHA